MENKSPPGVWAQLPLMLTVLVALSIKNRLNSISPFPKYPDHRIIPTHVSTATLPYPDSKVAQLAFIKTTLSPMPRLECANPDCRVVAQLKPWSRIHLRPLSLTWASSATITTSGGTNSTCKSHKT